VQSVKEPYLLYVLKQEGESRELDSFRRW